MRRESLIGITSLLLVGCAWTSDALQLGASTFQVSANASPARGGITGARGMALEAANEKCAELGRTISVTNIETETAFPANGVATVTFNCI